MGDPFDIHAVETFVPCREVIKVKWISSDPEHYRPELDLFDFQKNGIPTNFGKKDKFSTEQVQQTVKYKWGVGRTSSSDS